MGGQQVLGYQEDKGVGRVKMIRSGFEKGVVMPTRRKSTPRRRTREITPGFVQNLMQKYLNQCPAVDI